MLVLGKGKKRKRGRLALNVIDFFSHQLLGKVLDCNLGKQDDVWASPYHLLLHIENASRKLLSECW